MHITAILDHAEALDILRAAGHPLPRIPVRCNTCQLAFTTADGRPALAINQGGFARTAEDNEEEVNGLSPLVCADDPPPPDAAQLLVLATDRLLAE